MGTYTREKNELILKVLNLYDAGMSVKAIIRETQLSDRTVRRWISKFDINEKRTDIHCTDKKELHIEEVLRLHYQEGYKANKIAQVLHLSPTTVLKWITTFEKENGKPQGMDNNESKPTEIESLKQQIADLEEELRVEKMRNRLNDKIIEIAEKKYGIAIRKKAGAKQ
ncbi:MAG: helix-turn-helix domain-containing protein [Bacteroidales bacterium]|jgi:transposase|nr:helix-turn-helix domain-containing protein [Bacteroidales bacterium]